MADKIIIVKERRGYGCGTLLLLLVVICGAVALFNSGSDVPEQQPESPAHQAGPSSPSPTQTPSPPSKPDMVFWPSHVKANKDVRFSGTSANGAMGVTVASGAEIEVTDTDGDVITSKRGAMVATIPTDDTNFWALAEQKRADAMKQRERDRAAFEKAAANRPAPPAPAETNDDSSYGNEPAFHKSPWNGELTVPSAVSRAIKQSLKDPDSFQPRELLSLEKSAKSGVNCYKAVFTFGAKNSFGGYTLGTATAYVRGSELLGISVDQD